MPSLVASVRPATPFHVALLLAVLAVITWSPLVASGAPQPDLVVTALVLSPSTARVGDPVTATVTVRNQGSVAASPSIAALYLATSATSGGTSPVGAIPLGTLTIDGLSPGASQQVSRSFAVPAVARGSFPIVAVADGAATLAEAGETNNRRTATLRVTIPDLTVSRVILAPSHARVGDTVTATAVLRNAGQVPADPSALRLFFETAADVPVTSIGSTTSPPLAAGESREVSLTFTVPSVPTRHSYRVCARADPDGALPETDEGNNRQGAWLDVTIPDLTVSRVTLAPPHARVGDTVTAVALVRNKGPVPADASVLRFYFETGLGTPPSPPTLLGSATIAALGASESREVPFTFTVPSAPTRHSYHVWAQADPDGTLPETDEGNNRQGAWLDVTIPDLTIASLSLRPAPARAGDRLTAVALIRNRGPVPANASVLRFYFETGLGAPLSPPTPLGSAAIATLGASESREVLLPFTVPDVPAGRSYYVWAQADSDGTLAETNEGNNRRGTWLTVSLPDLTVSRVSLASTLTRAGDTVTVDLTVRNRGSVPANRSQASLYVASTSTAAMAGLVALTSADVPALEPGKEAALRTALTVPALPSGRYYVIAVADGPNDQNESSETNNHAAASFEVAAPIITLDTLELAPSVVPVGAASTATVRVTNRGRVPSRSTTAEIFLATNATARPVEGSSRRTLAIGSLSPGASVSLSAPVVVPNAEPAGYYAIVEVDRATAVGPGASAGAADAGASRPRRAVKVTVALPDLTVSDLLLTPNHAPVGAPIAVAVTLRNVGLASSSSTSLALYLSSQPEGPPLATLTAPEIQPGTSTRLAVAFVVPSTAPGSYQVTVVADSSGAITESVRTNNRVSSSFTIEKASSEDIWASAPFGILVSGMDHTTPRSEIATYMQKAKDAGARWVRSDFWWYSSEWFRGQWTWAYFDMLVDEASARGLQVIPILQGTPAWAATDGVFSYGVPDMTAWETFVAKTVERYRGRISVWEVWNEPDGPWYWKGSPGQYAELLARAHRAIKSADPTAMVWLGGLSQGGPTVIGDFLQRILNDPRYPAGQYFDVHNIHTNFRSMAGITDQIATNRAILRTFDLDKPLVVTEASYTSDTRFQWLAGYGGGQDGLARYITDAYETMLDAGILVAVWANISDYPGNDEYAGSGLVRADLSEKPAFAAFRRLAEDAE